MAKRNVKAEMPRLTEVWVQGKRQGSRTQTLQSTTETTRKKRPTNTKLPHYMQPTEAAKRRQESVRSTKRTLKDPKTTSRQVRSTSRTQRSPLVPNSAGNITHVPLSKKVALEHKFHDPAKTERRKACRKQKQPQQPITPKVPQKRNLSPDVVNKQTSTEPSLRSTKRRKVGHDEAQNDREDKLNTTFEVTDSDQSNPPQMTDNQKPLVVDQENRESFAPPNMPFLFTKSLPIQPSGSSSLESITEMDVCDTEDEVFVRPTPVTNRLRATVGRVKTPGVRGAAAAGVTPVDSDKFSQIHSLRQHLLSEKLKSASSPEEKLEILSQSPMIELSRKKTWHSSSPKPSLNFDDEDGMDDRDEQIKHEVQQDEVQQNERKGDAQQDELKDEIRMSAVKDEKTKDGMEVDETEKNEQKKDVAYFKQLVSANTQQLEETASHWDKVNEELTDVSEAVHGEIRTTACQARLIVAERFKQFSGLIANCEYNSGDRPVLEKDLEGFWDMIYFQVEDVLAKFANLEKMKSAGWVMDEAVTVVAAKPKVLKKKAVKPIKKAKVSSKFSAFKSQMLKKNEQKMDSPKPDSAITNSASRRKNAITKEANAVQQQDTSTESPKTYSFRRRTVENLLESRDRAQASTPANNRIHKNVLLRSASHKKSSRKTSTQAAFSASQSRRKSEHRSTNVDALEDTLATTPGMAQHRLSLARSQPSIQPISRRSCSPSAAMVRAMLSASKSGRVSNLNSPLTTCEERSSESSHESSILEYLIPTDKPSVLSPALARSKRKSTHKSLHKQVLSKGLTPGTAPISPALNSPATHLQKLKLDETPPEEDAFVDDLVVFTPLRTSEPTNRESWVTPRRSARLARIHSRVSLL